MYSNSGKEISEFDMIYEFFIAEYSVYSRKDIYNKFYPAQELDLLINIPKDKLNNLQKKIITDLLSKVRWYPDQYIFTWYNTKKIKWYESNVSLSKLLIQWFNCRSDNPKDILSRKLSDRYIKYKNEGLYQSDKWESIINAIKLWIALPKPIIIYSIKDNKYIILEWHNRIYCYLECHIQWLNSSCNVILGIIEDPIWWYFIE